MSHGGDADSQHGGSESELPQLQLSGLHDQAHRARRRSTISQRSLLSDTEEKTGPYLEGNFKLLDCIECGGDVMCCRWSPDGSHLAVGMCDGSIRIYGAHSPQLLFSLYDDATTASRLPVTQIRFMPHTEDMQPKYQHILMACYASGVVKFWHYTSNSCVHTLQEARQTLAMAVDLDGEHLVTGGASQQLFLYNVETMQRVHTLQPSENREVMDGHMFRVFATVFSPRDRNIFISGGWDDTVQYWDIRQQHSVKKFAGPHICGDALDIDPHYNHIVTGSWRKHCVLQIWDFASAVKLKDVPQDSITSSQLYCAQWLGKDSIVCGGNDLNMARMIDRGTLNTTGMLVDLPQGVYCIDNDRQGSHPRIAIGCNRFIYRLRGEKRS